MFDHFVILYLLAFNVQNTHWWKCCTLIADLFLTWCEFSYMIVLVKSNFSLAKTLSKNSHSTDVILVIKYIGFGDLSISETN